MKMTMTTKREIDEDWGESDIYVLGKYNQD